MAKPRYYVIRDQIDRWRALYGRLRGSGRYWLADRLRNAVGLAGVRVMGDVWYDHDAWECERWLCDFINRLRVTGCAGKRERPELLPMPGREAFAID